ncbi:MAG TPA: hypothetical protein VHS05_00275 [Pyrinomonadaceae bacterium]|nr:hypothetical protein [Pyrinomonadaceae bacterium]
MNSSIDPNEVLVIDKLEHWRKLSQATLKLAGFKVRVNANYDCPLVSEQKNGSLDLIILGCAGIGSDELQLIDRVRSNKLRILVLCTSLHMPAMRLLFLRGADDVAEKPFDSKQLLDVVGHAIQHITARSARLIF